MTPAVDATLAGVTCQVTLLGAFEDVFLRLQTEV